MCDTNQSTDFSVTIESPDCPQEESPLPAGSSADHPDKEPSPSHQGASVGDKKGVKRRYTEEQTSLLNASFLKKQKLSKDEKTELAEKTGLAVNQVARWFQNKRAARRNTTAKKVNETAKEGAQIGSGFQLTSEELAGLVAQIVKALAEKKELQQEIKDVEPQVEEAEPLEAQDPCPQSLESENHQIQSHQLNLLSMDRLGDSKEQAQEAAQELQETQDFGDCSLRPDEDVEGLMKTIASLFPSATPRKSRVRYTEEQQKKLLEALEVTDRPNAAQRKQIAELTGLLPTQVSRWFQNRRQDASKAMKAEDQ
uniref:Homeobox domain-containing protein n=1 Tax=Steinernema glaseri TaxID=37863 RepID=A0A1I8A9K4_9BILA